MLTVARSRTPASLLSHSLKKPCCEHTSPTPFLQASTRCMASSAKVSPLSRPLPPGTWDSHMHVVEPDRFPLDPKAKYTPHPHTLADARAFYRSLAIENLVLVQPSIYGTDNACMLEALRELTPQHGRAVVELDPHNTTPETLREWHDMGVRGVRVNLVSVGRDLSDDELRDELAGYARVIRPLPNWVLQLYIPLKLVTTLEKIAPDLDVAKLCIDHFGSPPLPKGPTQGFDPYMLDGFAALVRLLRAKKTWIKLSAPYRIAGQDPQGWSNLDVLGRELVGQAPDQVVYATDWPHTRFEDVDSAPFIETCYRWCERAPYPPEGMREKLFRTNAERLWDVPI